ncbi:LCP family protein [Candidatus Parcubacteria bacterium]|nr:LCP family protein [Candidatus Parcubacteria bacterium]
MSDPIPPTTNPDIKPRPRPRRRRWWLWVTMIAIVAALSALFGKAGYTINHISVSGAINEAKILPQPDFVAKEDPDRINILLLGLRGRGDPDGGLLTDTLLLAVINTKRNQVALVSIPRDLLVRIPNQEARERINAAYARGEERHPRGGGLAYAKRVVSEIVGYTIDHAVSVDFEAFREIVDVVGGVDVTLKEPFVEPTQWAGYPAFTAHNGAFVLEAGPNHLTGEQALFYVRSRFSTSDFDRARRQQQVLLALKDKVLTLGVLANPVTLNGILNSIASHVLTDASGEEIQALLGLAARFGTTPVKRKVLDTAPEGLLEETSVEGAFVLVPKGGTYADIRATMEHLFD